MKPLSQKTLDKKYENAHISEDEKILLHKYLACFSNLYGSMIASDLWDVFKQYKERITKEKFYNFIDIAQREENDYYIVNLNEAYSGETSDKTKDKLLVHKDLVGYGIGKYWSMTVLETKKDYSHDIYVPKSKEELFKYERDVFYDTKEGKERSLHLGIVRKTVFE